MAAFGSTSFGAAATGGNFGAAPTGSNYNPNKDAELVQPPSDGISSLHFSPTSNYLAVTSWDNQVRCYEVQPTGQSQPKAAFAAPAPPLCSAWTSDGSKILSAGCDKEAKMWDLQSNQQQTVAKHDAPIRHMNFFNNMLVTGSWDKTLRYWDLRQPNPAHTQTLPERVYGMDVRHPLLVVGLANRRIQIFNLSNPGTVYKEIESPLKYQTRCITCFPDSTGYLVGSIEGRVAVHHVEDNMQSKNFTFKCHRDQSNGDGIWAVNSVEFHPAHGTFVTAGSDGQYNFWDKDSKQRLKAMQRGSHPIPCASFNKEGTIYAYAASYDWSEGHSKHQAASAKNYVLLHQPQDNEVKSRNRSTSSSRR